MKFTKIFIVFTFLLAFAFQVSAQDEKPKIIWKNFKSAYKNPEFIGQSIFNESEETISFIPSWFIKDYVLARLLIFNEENKTWDSAGPYLSCALVPKVKNLTVTKILPKEEKFVLLDFGEVLFYSSKEKIDKKKRFKVSLIFNSENSNKKFESISPEFSIID